MHTCKHEYECKKTQSSHFASWFRKMICLLTLLMIFFSLGNCNGEAIIVDFSHDLKPFIFKILVVTRITWRKRSTSETGKCINFLTTPRMAELIAKWNTQWASNVWVWVLVYPKYFLPGLPHLLQDQYLVRLPCSPMWPWEPHDDGQVRPH